ncbi:MAG: 50S ribosomal protein L9, partial [Sphingomonadales bacterium]|nr:50S ribosomal protein L9 [Sphingomonadales bacterium]
MDIILLERVGNLGTIGDVVTVKDGFARNYLLPSKKALRANDHNRKVFEENRARLEQENEDRRGAAEKEAGKLDGTTIELIRQASNTGQLYGSVTVRDIAIALDEKGEKVTKKQIVLERPIKAIGVHEVTINLHAEVDVTIKVNVARSPEEAERQAEGVDVIAEMFDKEQAEIAAAELAPESEAAAGETEGEAAEAAETEGETAEAPETEAASAEDEGAAEEGAEKATEETSDEPSE